MTTHPTPSRTGRSVTIIAGALWFLFVFAILGFEARP